MTAIVGTINRRGVAFAADSAATHTMSSKRKITNNANKIFELSLSQPIGVAICGNLDFLGLPWEEIFKLFRKHIAGVVIQTVEECPSLFFDFLKSSILPELLQMQNGQFKYTADRMVSELIELANKRLEEAGIARTDKLTIDNSVAILREWESTYTGYQKCDSLSSLSLDEFKQYGEAMMRNSIKPFTTSPDCPADFYDCFANTLYLVTTSAYHAYLSKTELVFWGYGEKELFPSYFAYAISLVINGLIKLTKTGEYVVSNDSTACVAPFAQTDVANTVVRGIDDELRNEFYKHNVDAMTLFRDEIASKLSSVGAPSALVDAVQSIDVSAYAGHFKSSMDDYIHEHYVDKLLDTVAYLSKEDLADMAESLVRMTYLKRRITSEEESVGGPVDVAVITKGDGFVWIKRKHYFSSELNPHYFERKQ